MIVYKVVCEYVRVNKEKLKQEEINELFETVRFPFLTFGKNFYPHYRSFGIVDFHVKLLNESPLLSSPLLSVHSTHTEQLKEAEGNPHVPRHLLTEALLGMYIVCCYLEFI